MASIYNLKSDKFTDHFQETDQSGPKLSQTFLLFLFRVVAQKDVIFAVCSLVQRIIEGYVDHSFSPSQMALDSDIEQCLLFVIPTENLTQINSFDYNFHLEFH